MTTLVVTVQNRINKSTTQSGGSRTGFYRRSIHTIGSGDVSGFWLAYDNWRGEASNGQVVNTGNDYTLSLVSAEVNSAWAPINFSESRAVTIANGAVKVLSAYITPAMFGLTKFDLGQDFWVNELGTIPASTSRLPYTARAVNDFSGQQFGFYDPANVTLGNVDGLGPMTITGTINATTHATVAYMGAPIILGNFVGGDKPARMVKGDSQTEGTGSVTGWKHGRGWWQRANTNAAGTAEWIATMNWAVHGSAAALMYHSAPIRAYDEHANSLVVGHGYNDIGLGGTGQTGAQMVTRQTTIINNFKAVVPNAKIGVLPLGPRSDSSNLWVDEANQTTLANWGAVGYPADYNALLPTSGFDVVLSVNSVKGTDPYKFKTNGSSRAFAYDNTHWSDGGQIAVGTENRAALYALDPVIDTAPTQFTFTDLTDQVVSTPVESNSITVAGINAAAAISVTGGEYAVNAGAGFGAFTSAPTTVLVGNTVKVRHVTSGSASTAVNTVLTIGGVTDTFTSTTAAAVEVPAVGNITITGIRSGNGKFNSNAQGEIVPGPGAGVIFSDDFSSGDLNKQLNGSPFWTSATNLGVISGFSRAGNTGNCVRFNFNIVAEAISELRYNLGNQYSQLYFQFYLYYPNGAESPTRGPRAALTGGNNKFFRVWADAPNGSGNGEDPKFGASYYSLAPSGDSQIGAQAGVYPVSAPGSVSQVPTESPAFTPILNDTLRGTWVKVKFRVKAGTEAGHPNAEFQCWTNNVQRWNLTNLDAYSPGGVYTGLRKGYIMGAQDAVWQNAGTYIYMSDFVVSTEDIV